MSPYANRAHRAAYEKGRAAYAAGLTRWDCPYSARAAAAGPGGGRLPTGARGFANAWLRGWGDARDEAARGEGATA